MTSLHSVAISKLFMAQNQRSKSQQRQVHADLFFSTAKALSTSNSYPLVKPSMASFTVRFWSGWVRAVGSNFQTSGRTTIGFSAMTTRPLTHQFLFDNSWLPKTLQWFPNPHPPIRLTSPTATFFYSPRWNYGWKGAVLTRMRRCTQNRKRLSTHSHFRTSRDAWNHGKYAGIAVYMPKGLLRKKRWKTGITDRKFFLSNFRIFWIASHI